MSKKEKKKNLVGQGDKENPKQHEPEVMYEMGYKKGQRLRGFLEILAGAAILCLGLWLWSRTWGTMLLFTNAAIGRLARYYWIVWIIAAVILIAGLITMRKVRIEKKPDDTKTKDAEETLILSDTSVTEDGGEQNAPDAEKPIPLDTENRTGADVKKRIAVDMENRTAVDTENRTGADVKKRIAVDTENRAGTGVEKPIPVEIAKQIGSDVDKSDGTNQAAVTTKEKTAEVPSAESMKITDNKCPGCGKDKKTGAAFCIYCGYKF